MSALVTVGMPARNASPYIGAALDSVLRQEGVALQVLVVDDASSDDTSAVAKRHADARVTIVRNDVRLGIGASHNRILHETSSELLVHVDADDIVLPGALAHMAQALRDRPRAAQAYCDFVPATVDGTVDPDVAIRWRTQLARARQAPIPHARHLLQYGMIVNHLRTYRRAALLDVGGFNETLPWAVDYEIALRLADHWEFVHVPQELYIKRILPSGASESVPFGALRFWARRAGLVHAQLWRNGGRVAGHSAITAYPLLLAGLADAVAGTVRTRRSSPERHQRSTG